MRLRQVLRAAIALMVVALPIQLLAQTKPQSDGNNALVRRWDFQDGLDGWRADHDVTKFVPLATACVALSGLVGDR